MDSKQERIETVVRNIMSGDNTCATLTNAALNSDDEYFRKAVAPMAEVYEAEISLLRKQRDDALRDAENKRFALESVLSNLDLPVGPVREAVARAMPAHPLLGG